MFHWICPECGREIPPTVKECPACDPAAPAAPAVSASAPEPVLALAAIPVEANPVEQPEPAKPEQPLALKAEPEPEPEQILDPLLVLAEQIRSAQTEASQPAPAETQELPQLAAAVERAEVPPDAPVVSTPVEPMQTPDETKSQPIALLAPPEPAQQQIAPPEPNPVEEVAPVQASEAIPPAAPPQSETPALEVAANQKEPAPAVEAVAPPQEVTPAPPLEAAAPVAPQQAAAEPPAPEITAEPAPAPAVEAVAPVLPLPAPPVQPETPAAEAKIETKLGEQPTPVLKNLPEPPPPADKPPSGSWLQLAPLQDYSSAATRAMQPAAPPVQILAPDAGPKMTLPGPALPPKLERLQEASVVTVIGEEPLRAPRRGGMPGWLISLMLMLGIPLAGAGLLFYFSPIGHSNAEAKQPPQQSAQPAAAETVSHSASQLVEVTGFRIVVDFSKKSEIHYLVVNHSPADLSDVTVYVTLRAVNAKPGQPPLTRFSFRAPNLGPFESKEMVSPIEKLARNVVIPDWQDLRADVQIGQ